MPYCCLVAPLCLPVTPRTVAHQAPLSLEFSRQAHWSGLPFPSPGNIPNPGIKPRFPASQADSLPLSHSGSRICFILNFKNYFSDYLIKLFLKKKTRISHRNAARVCHGCVSPGERGVLGSGSFSLSEGASTWRVGRWKPGRRGQVPGRPEQGLQSGGSRSGWHTAGPELLPSWEEEKEKEERETKGSSIFKAAASLCQGPGWRCKPVRLIETKLQVQREVIRKPPSGSMLPFKFHLIKPKEKKPLSLLPSSPGHPSPDTQTAHPPLGPPPPAFLSPLPGRRGTSPLIPYPLHTSSPKIRVLSCLHQWVPPLSPS